MAQRTVCLCDGKYIGIETIFTVINGKQINIPAKVEALREKSRHNQLFCPCGCGANLTLVAGDRNLREQHFRLKAGECEKECQFVTERKKSVDSKVILKCWMDDKLKDNNIESRVPINALDDINRKYEFTLLSRDKSVAISYSHDRVNLSDEKFDILESNSMDITIIYVVDYINGGVNGQYPESLMKIQSRQGYCLYLLIDGVNYYKAELKAVFFDQDIDGLWQEITFADAPISEYDIDTNGSVIFEGKSLFEKLSFEKNEFEKHKENIRIQREREEIERIKTQQEFEAALEDVFIQQETQIRDADGNRWIKCEFCGKIALEKEFNLYGGPGRVNLGICYDCSRSNPAVHVRNVPIKESKRKRFDPNICPECGAKLIEISGRFDLFIGCSNYPNCRYTKSNNKKYEGGSKR